MRLPLFLSLFAAALFVFCPCDAQDDLFSTVAMETAFEKTAPPSLDVASIKGAISDTEFLERITSNAALAQVLTAAGFNPETKEGAVVFKVVQGKWQLPVSMRILVEQDRIACEVSLAKLSDNEINKETLIELLTSSDLNQGAFFAYDRQNQLIQLRVALSNRAVTVRKLKSDLGELGNLAELKSEIWSNLDAGSKSKPNKDLTKTDAPPARQQNSPSTTPSPQVFSLVGKWSASLSTGEAFAFQLTADSRFQLVHVKSGKSTSSKGKATRSGDRLTLVGDDKVTLNCRVKQVSTDSFELSVMDAKDNASVALSFKKAK